MRVKREKKMNKNDIGSCNIYLFIFLGLNIFSVLFLISQCNHSQHDCSFFFTTVVVEPACFVGAKTLWRTTVLAKIADLGCVKLTMVAGQRSVLNKGNRLFFGHTQLLPLFYSQQFPFLFFNQYLQRLTHAGWIIYKNGPWGWIKKWKTKLTLEWKEKKERLRLWLHLPPGHVTHVSWCQARTTVSQHSVQYILMCRWTILTHCSLLASSTRMSLLKELHRSQPLSLFLPTSLPLARPPTVFCSSGCRSDKNSLCHRLHLPASRCFHLLHIGHFIRIQPWSNES